MVFTMLQRERSNRPFTILELMVVLAVVLILSSLLLPQLLKARQTGRHAAWMAIKRSHQLDTNCLAYYTFEEGKGTKVENLAAAAEVESDFDPTQLDATVMQGAVANSNQWGRGRFPHKRSLVFNGANTWVRIPYHAVLDECAQEFTIETWVYPASSEGTRPIFTAGAPANGIGIFTDEFSGTGFQAGGVFSGTPMIEPGQWTHIVAVYDGTSLTQYVNGQRVASGSNPKDYSGKIVFENANNYLAIGGGWNSHWRGIIDELAIYKVALSTSDIVNHYLQGMPR